MGYLTSNLDISPVPLRRYTSPTPVRPHFTSTPVTTTLPNTFLRRRTREVLDLLEHAVLAPDSDPRGLSLLEACDLIRPIHSVLPNGLHLMIVRTRDHHKLAIRRARIQARKETLIRMVNRKIVVSERVVGEEGD